MQSQPSLRKLIGGNNMKKREALFGNRFRAWMRAHHDDFPSCAFELKQTTTNSIPFSDVQDHQVQALLAAKTRKGILYKAPDDSRGVKPFDFFHLSRASAYVVISYPKPAKAEVIDIDTFLMEKERSKRKSLTSERAHEISTFSF